MFMILINSLDSEFNVGTGNGKQFATGKGTENEKIAFEIARKPTK